MDFLNKIKSFLLDYKFNIILGCLFIIIVLISNAVVYFSLFHQLNSKKYIEDVVPIQEKIEDKAETEHIHYLVDIKGAVKNPGVYQISKGERVIDVLKKAGGLLENADTSVNNLSKYVIDEMVIVIYTKEEVAKFSEVKELESQKLEDCKNYNEAVINNSCIEVETTTDTTYDEIDKKISLNTASLELLMTLPGIGEAKARSIITYREKEGKFSKIEDIMNISGIGESIFEKIKDYITV